MSEVIVSKNGGTSGADGYAVGLSIENSASSLVTVVSAPGRLNPEQLGRYTGSFVGDEELFGSKVTDQLLGVHEQYVITGEADPQRLSSIAARYELIVEELGINALRGDWLKDIPAKIESTVRAGADYASMLGEQLQAQVYAAAAGLTILDPGRAGQPLTPRDRNAWQDWLSAAIQPGERYVMPGNIWFDGQRLRTFDRGGSDISGALAAYGVGASEYHNMTDTSCLSADPRMFDASQLRHIDALTYEEGRELGRNGSGLLHPAAIVPLMGTGIPTFVRDTFNAETRGTLYTDEITDKERSGKVMAVSLMRNVVFLEVHEPGMSEQAGKIAGISTAIADTGVSVVDIVGHGADRQIAIVGGDDEARLAETVLRELVNGDGTVTSTKYGMLTLVGHEIGRNDLSIRSQVEDTRNLGPIDIPPLTGRHSIRIPIARDSAEEVTRAAHATLVEA